MRPSEPTPCWEIDPRWPKFCAALANGRKRCRKGTCFLMEQEADQFRDHT